MPRSLRRAFTGLAVVAVLVAAAVLPVAAFRVADPIDQVIDVDFDNISDLDTVSDLTVRSLTFNVRGTRTGNEDAMHITATGISCAADADAANPAPCVTINIAPDAKLDRLMISLNNIVGPNAVKINVEGTLVNANVALVWLGGCTRAGSSCVSFSTGAGATFANSSFAVFSTTINTFGAGHQRASFVHYSLEGHVAHSSFHHTNLFNVAPEPATGPVQVTGNVGSGFVGSSWRFEGLRNVSYNLTGSLGAGSSFTVLDSNSSIVTDRAVAVINMTDSALLVDGCMYLYMHFGGAPDGRMVLRGTSAKISGALVTNQHVEDKKVGIFFDVDLEEGSTLAVADWPEMDVRGLSFYHNGALGARCGINVTNSAIVSLELTPLASDACGPASPCVISVANNSIYGIELNGFLSAGTLVQIQHNAERKSSGKTTFNRGLRGTGIISWISNNHTFAGYLNGFEGTLELWGGKYGPNYPAENVLQFLSLPLPRRVTMSQIAEPIVLSGAVFDSNKTHEAAMAALQFSCAKVRDKSAMSKNKGADLPLTKPCSLDAFFTRCDEGLANYYPYEGGNRSEPTANRHPSLCTEAPRVVPPAPTPTPDDKSSDDKRRKTVIAAVLVGAGVLLAVAVVGFFIYRAQRRAAEYSEVPDSTAAAAAAPIVSSTDGAVGTEDHVQ